MLPTKKIVLLIVLLIPVSIAFVAHASMVRNCIFKARIVDIQKDEEKIKKDHPDVTFGGVCYADVYFVQIEALDMNNSYYLGNNESELPYCEGLVGMLDKKSRMDSDRPIGIKLCINQKVDPPKIGDVIDIRYNWSMGRTDTKATVTWTYLSLYMDREPRKAAMSKQCDNGDGGICVQLGQMYWKDKDEDKEIESYRKACEINKRSCTYYINALNRTGRQDELKTK